MKTLTTTEQQALVVAAPAGPVPCASTAAVTRDRRYRMRAIPTCIATDESGTHRTVFGDWNRPRRLVRCVT